MYLCPMKLIDFLTQELHHNRSLAEKADQLFVSREVKKGTHLVTDGFNTDRVYFFEQGIAREFTNVDGNEVTNYFHLENTFYIPLNYLFFGDDLTTSLEMEEDGVVRIAPYYDIEQMMADNLSLQRFAFQMYSGTIRQMFAISHSLQHRSAAERYEALLREQPDIVLRVPLGHIASYLGITQQRLSVIRKEVKL